MKFIGKHPKADAADELIATVPDYRVQEVMRYFSGIVAQLEDEVKRLSDEFDAYRDLTQVYERKAERTFYGATINKSASENTPVGGESVVG